MMEFYTNFRTPNQIGEKNNLPSMTVPDQSMTIPEIIARFVRTGSLPVPSRSDQGDNEAFDPDFDPLDYSPSDAKDQFEIATKALSSDKVETSPDPVPQEQEKTSSTNNT